MLTPVSPTACDRARTAISAQLDGELSELGAARLAAHLRVCAACEAFAFELASIAARLRGAPLEQPGVSVVLPARGRVPTLRLAAVAVAVAAGASSLALGHALNSKNRPAKTATGTQLGPSLEQDMLNQHVLAMERRLRPATPPVSSRNGPLVPL
jgi:predicted anti-sigma-YlaC factor YlaD